MYSATYKWTLVVYYKEYQCLWATDGSVNKGFLNCTAETDGTYIHFSISTLLVTTYSTFHRTGQVDRSPVLNFLIGCFHLLALVLLYTLRFTLLAI